MRVEIRVSAAVSPEWRGLVDSRRRSGHAIGVIYGGLEAVLSQLSTLLDNFSKDVY